MRNGSSSTALPLSGTVSAVRPMPPRSSAAFTMSATAHCCGELEGASLPLGSFDSILLFNVLPHFAAVEGAIRRVKELLTVSGRLAIGHLMDSSELNAFHSSVEGPVCHDKLPRVEVLVVLLRALGLRVLQAEERPGHENFLMHVQPTTDGDN